MDTDRQYWLASMLRIVRPVLEALSERRLKASMPEQNAGDRQEFTHHEALGRTLSGLAQWLQTGEAVGEEGKLREHYAALSRRLSMPAQIRILRIT